MFRNCKHCGAKFETSENSERAFCSRPCVARFNNVRKRGKVKINGVFIDSESLPECLCNECKKPLEDRRDSFCNNSCATKFNNRKRYASGWRLSEESRQKKSKTCSEAGKRYYSKHKIENSRKGKIRIEGKWILDVKIKKICPYCQEEFETSQYKPQKYCNSKICERSLRSDIAKKRIAIYGSKGGFCPWKEFIDQRGRKVRYQGSYEFRYVKCLDKLLELGKIQDWKRSNLRIAYGDNNSYFPDFEVLINNIWEVHEVKGYLRPEDEFKFKAARQTGLTFRILFDTDIKEIENLIGLKI